ncbi:MAG: FIST C-terminal domain-containing protein [Leptospirales bacterium]|nr:FIST C-terminal domain-containing protein [Leptospirales bacterium]
MLKCVSVYTSEVDNTEIAVSEIKQQLDAKIALLENSVGIIMCHPEFISTGVLKAVCESIPFDLTGITTSSQAVNDDSGELILTVFVMTSDDVRFKTGVTESIGDDVDGSINAAYARVAADVSGVPKLVFIFPPFGLHAGDMYVRAWGKIISNTPLFGTCAIDGTVDFSECETIYNGTNYKNEMSFVLCYGNISPRFMVATLSERNAVSSKAEVTKAAGNCVYEINNDNALKYFEERGFAESVRYTPFMIDLLKREDYDGVPVIRGHACFTEEGAAIFYGDVDEGSTFTMLRCDPDDILATTRQKLEMINGLPNVNGVLLFPCVVRRAALLGVNKHLMELQNARDMINPEIPFMMGYAGGEICPTSVRDGIPTNRFHNHSLVILVI